MVLMAAEGKTNKAIAAELGVDENKVGRWRSRVAGEGARAIEKERPRGANQGGKDTEGQARLRSRVLEATTQTTPGDATHWSCRPMARQVGTTHSFVNRVWRAHGLKPHLIRTFKLSSDPRFEEKLRDVVGLYLDPPHNAAVFSFDEKSQIQALDRTQPGLPMKKGRCATLTHDYKRHGTTTLFAALQLATGKVIGKTYRRYRHQGVLRFLREVEKTVPKKQEIHIVLDNYATHKHEAVLGWIERQKRIFLHFTPTSASWVNLVERFFATLTQKQTRRGVFTSLSHLEKCLRQYLNSYNDDPRQDTSIDVESTDVHVYGGWMDHNYFEVKRLSGSGLNRETGDLTTIDAVLAYSLGSETGSNPMAALGSATWEGASLGYIMGYQSKSGVYVGTQFYTDSNLIFNSDATIRVDFSDETLDARFDNFTISDPILHEDAEGNIDKIEFFDVPYYYGQFERGMPLTGIFPWAPTLGLELNEMKGIAGAFYGPNHEEVGGTFFATTRRPVEQVIIGAFGAKRQ